jgi:hypothetical protein
VWALALNTLGVVLGSAELTVTVTNDSTRPTVTLNAPATASGTVTVQASATDNSGTVKRMQLLLDGTVV